MRRVHRRSGRRLEEDVSKEGEGRSPFTERVGKNSQRASFPQRKDTLVTFLWYGVFAGGGHSCPSPAFTGRDGCQTRPALVLVANG
jgi:hypothetical protein